jgi:threonine aldolase
VIDLRTDALGRPTEAMWAAMRTHEPGWATFGEDEAVRALEARGAALCGKAAALFVPTGGMANLVAMLAWTSPGDGLIADRRAHVVRAEYAGYAAVAGLALRALDGARGHISAEQVAALLGDAPAGRPQPAGLVWLENTHGACGGTVQTVAEVAAVCAAAGGVPVHMDGARALNAAVALGVELDVLVAPVDSVMLNLNKGIGAPAGALLCGDEAFVARARDRLGRVGGASLHLAGLWAAAALEALDEAPARVAHASGVAGRLAAALPVEVSPVETNILLVRTAISVSQLRARGIGAYPHGADQVRLVTHAGIDDGDIPAIVAAFSS